MSIVFTYLRDKYKKGIFVLGWQLLLFITLYLEGIDIEKLLYAMGLSIVGLIVSGAWDFVQYRKKHIELIRALESIEDTTERLPVPEGLIEEDYNKAIHKIFDHQDQQAKDHQKIKENTEEFLTIWTHQVKTPLTALQLAVNEIEEPLRSEMSARLFEIEQYCDMILQYLRLESDSTDYIFKEYKVKSIVNQSVKYFARTFIRKGLSVKVDIEDEALIATDEKWLVFVLKQLISNALKYTDKGCITIDMPSKNVIRIRDTGIGIAKEDLPRIFERGYTGFNGRKDKKATGLGLFLVDSIIKKLNGSVAIESEIDQGTTVCVQLGNLAEV